MKMATGIAKAYSAEDTPLLWHAIEAQDGYELQHMLTNKFPAETYRLQPS
jgi:hypothetical protein